MKKITAIILALLMVLGLAACGGDNVEVIGSTVITNDDPVSTPEATPEATPEITPEPTPEATPEPNLEAVPEADAKATAESFIGAAIEELYAAIGEPASSDYAPSCIGPGEDGNLYYDGFVVYTYREDGMETVEYVE